MDADAPASEEIRPLPAESSPMLALEGKAQARTVFVPRRNRDVREPGSGDPLTSIPRTKSSTRVPGRSIIIAVDSRGHSRDAFAWAIGNILLPNDILILATSVVSSASPGAGGFMRKLGKYVAGACSALASLKAPDYFTVSPETILHKYASFCTLYQIPFEVRKLQHVDMSAGEALVKLSKECNASAVVVGSSNKSKKDRLLLGSTSEFVAQNAMCAVAVVKRRHHLDAVVPSAPGENGVTGLDSSGSGNSSKRGDSEVVHRNHDLIAAPKGQRRIGIGIADTPHSMAALSWVLESLARPAGPPRLSAGALASDCGSGASGDAAVSISHVAVGSSGSGGSEPGVVKGDRVFLVHVALQGSDDAAREALFARCGAECEALGVAWERLEGTCSAGSSSSANSASAATAATLASLVALSSLDILVVGNRGRGAVKRSLFGSVSDGTIRSCPCDLVVVKRQHRFEAKSYLQQQGQVYAARSTSPRGPLAASGFPIRPDFDIVHADGEVKS